MPNHSRTSGILSIVSGGLGILGGIFYSVFLVFIMRAMYGLDGQPYYNAPNSEFIQLSTMLYVVIGIFIILIGILAIVGGVFALKRKRWGLALTGAIAGTVVFFPTGIPAIIYVSMAKPEFSAQIPASPDITQ